MVGDDGASRGEPRLTCPMLAAFLANRLPPPTGDVECIVEPAVPQEKDKTFRVCPDCTLDPLQPHRILASRWDAHVKGRKHRACMRSRLGKREATTGPEAEAKRRERQLRKQVAPSVDDELVDARDRER